ncbi:MAG TPA: helicase C-terminal domain-containing protein [Thermoanaerobaculia bacterium]|nr:helicase C-terminal domain-containing protein [Thermoanaerobaculia bacterium]
MARFDDESLTLRLSVADLLERDLVRRIGFGQRGGFERLWVGQAIHSHYQEQALARDGSYQREVVLRSTIEHRGWTVEVLGRIDAVRRDPDGVQVVEEIKSVRRDVELSPTLAELYRRQAALYAWMLSQESGELIRAELVLITIGDDDPDPQRIEVEVDARALEAGIRRRLDQLLHEHQTRRSAREQRRAAAARLAFPFHRPRPGQEQIVEAVTRALDQREHLLVEAPTGLGKTAAALFPALRHALEHDRRVFVLTAKTLQQRMSTAVLEMLNTEGAFRSLRLRAKARMCANHEVLCHEDYCGYARDYSLKLSRSGLLSQLMDDHPHLDPDAIFGASRDHEVCPFEVSLELTEKVQVVVCDYNYAFDPHVALSAFGADSDLSDTVLVIDEIHNLVDRGRGYYSPVLSARAARSTADSIARLETGPIGERLSALATEVARLVERAVAEAFPEGAGRATVEGDLPSEELWGLRPSLDRAFVDYLEHRRETRSFRSEDPFVRLYFEVLRFLDTLALAERHGESFARCLEVEDEDSRLRLLCKDASRYLGAVIQRCRSAIGLSATLSPPEFYRDLLGFDPQRTAELRVPSPFPAEHRALVIDGTVSTEWRVRARYYQPIAERLGALASTVPGNCLALFPSYAFLAEVAERLPTDLGKRVLVQRRADDERQREEILDTLRGALFGDVLLLAVAGGVFAEGVDYPGDMLKAVAVIGPCLPAVSLEQKLLQEYYEERFGRGFEYAFVVPGMTRVVQAAGRLIRSPGDRGVIALFGRRFLSELYSRHMPMDWLEGAEADGLSGDPAEVAAAFFEVATSAP